MNMKLRNIPFSPPDMTEAEAIEVREAILSGWITTGPKTKEFERLIAICCQTKKAVALNSATAAMELTLRVLGVGPGDEVIVPAYTYTATASVVHHVGAKIVMVDVAPDSFEIDYDRIADAITERTKEVMPVDLGGVMCDYDRVFAAVESKRELFRPANDIQKAFGRVVMLADAAHAFGARRRVNLNLNLDRVAYLKHYGEDFQSSGHLYLVRLLGKDAEYRNEVIRKMAEKGIACNVHYKPLPMMTAYKNLGFDIKDYPNAYRQFENEVTLPLHTRLTDEDVEYVIGNFVDIISR